MLEKAIKTLGEREKPLPHSDQGWQYKMRAYQSKLKENNITQSMSRKGNCLDNAVCENFFGILKSEFFHVDKFSDTKNFIKQLREYIYYYNNKRIKQKLNGLSPIEYREQAVSA